MNRAFINSSNPSIDTTSNSTLTVDSPSNNEANNSSPARKLLLPNKNRLSHSKYRQLEDEYEEEESREQDSRKGTTDTYESSNPTDQRRHYSNNNRQNRESPFVRSPYHHTDDSAAEASSEDNFDDEDEPQASAKGKTGKEYLIASSHNYTARKRHVGSSNEQQTQNQQNSGKAGGKSVTISTNSGQGNRPLPTYTSLNPSASPLDNNNSNSNMYITGDRQHLIWSMNDLSTEVQDQFDGEHKQYATTKQAFYDQSIHNFVRDEVHIMLQIIFYEWKSCATIYNPIYLVLFVLFYCISLPGAYLHYSLLTYFPVRFREYPEERELRSQGIYTAIGISLWSTLFYFVCLCIANPNYHHLVNEENGEISYQVGIDLNPLSMLMSVALVGFHLLALRIIADELGMSVKVYISGVWLVNILYIASTLFYAYGHLSLSHRASILDLILRTFTVFIYTIVALQSIPFWKVYDVKNNLIFDNEMNGLTSDSCISMMLTFLLVVASIAFAFFFYLLYSYSHH